MMIEFYVPHLFSWTFSCTQGQAVAFSKDKREEDELDSRVVRVHLSTFKGHLILHVGAVVHETHGFDLQICQMLTTGNNKPIIQ